MYAHSLTFKDLVLQLERYPKENHCLFIGDTAFTYGDLTKSVHSLAIALRKLGVAKGDRVAAWLPNCFEWVVALLAVGKIGAILVPVNTRFKTDEAQYILSQSESKVVIMQPSFLKHNYLQSLAAWVPDMDQRRTGRIRSTALPSLEHVICLGEQPPSGTISWTEAMQYEDETMEADIVIDKYDPVLIQYTSGTTSFPKGALLTHYGLLHNAYNVGKRMHITNQDRLFSASPYAHIGGVTMHVLMSLINGAPFYTVEYFDPERIMNIVSEQRCTVYSGIDSLFLLVIEHPAYKKQYFAHVRVGWTTGSPKTIKLISEKTGIKDLLCIYGLSESSPNVTICDIDDPLPKKQQTVGRPHDGTEVCIVDPDTRRQLPAGTKGEIAVRGYQVMLGYYNKAKETEAVLSSDGWLYSGDMGELDHEGYLYYYGRYKEIIRVGGENFSPQEVEGLLYEHPLIEQAAVVGIPNGTYGEIPVAVVRKKEHPAALTEEEVIRYLKDKLAHFKVPRHVHFVPEFPMTESGKIQKYKLQESLLALGIASKTS